VPVQLSDGEAELATVGAAAAFDTLNTFGMPAQRTGTPLPVTGVSLGSFRFTTDRGPLTLPAWLFTVRDGLGPFAVVALARQAFRGYDEQLLGADGPVRISADGRTLTVPVPQGASCTSGSPPAPQAEALESTNAVAVGPAPVSPSPQPTDCVLPAYLRLVDAQVTLAAPLGGRVLVDGNGNPYQVTR
jgi:hypothetical protein